MLANLFSSCAGPCPLLLPIISGLTVTLLLQLRHVVACSSSAMAQRQLSGELMPPTLDCDQLVIFRWKALMHIFWATSLRGNSVPTCCCFTRDRWRRCADVNPEWVEFVCVTVFLTLVKETTFKEERHSMYYPQRREAKECFPPRTHG